MMKKIRATLNIDLKEAAIQRSAETFVVQIAAFDKFEKRQLPSRKQET